MRNRGPAMYCILYLLDYHADYHERMHPMTIQAITSKNRSSSSSSSSSAADLALAAALAESERISSAVQSPVTPKSAAGEASERGVSRSAPSEMSEADVNLVVGEMRQALRDHATNLDFAIDNNSGRMVVKIIDRTNGEVLRQYPTEEMLQLQESIERMSGVLVSTHA